MVRCLALVCIAGCNDLAVQAPKAVIGSAATKDFNPYGPALERSTLGVVGHPTAYPAITNSLYELNPGKYRVVVRWPWVEQYGQSYLNDIHTFLNHLKAIGATPYINLVDTPAWVRGCAESGPCPNGGASAPPLYEHMTAFQNFITQMVVEFGPNSGHSATVSYFGVFNEPNDPSFDISSRHPDPVQVYSTFVHHAAPIIKGHGAMVVGPELGPGLDPRRNANDPTGNRQLPERWLSDYMAEGAGWTTDILSVHAYAGSGEVDDPYPGVAIVAHNHLTQNGVWPYGNWRLWITEAGAAGNFWFSNPDNQARWVVKAFSDFAEYRANNPGTRWDALFTFQHWEWPASTQPLPNDLLFNLMDYSNESDFFKKPAYWCYAKVSQGYAPSSLTPPGC